MTDQDTGSTPAALYEDAISRATEGDYEAAVIQLKNALQEAPRDLPARIALGRFQLRTGQGAAAEKELRTALSLGADAAQVLPLLGNALLMQRKHEEILNAVHSPDPRLDSSFELVTLRSRAHFELDQLEEAEAGFRQARDTAPRRPEPVVGLALIATARARYEEAMSLIDEALELSPDDTEAWFQKGEIARAYRQPEVALEAYGQTLSRNPNHMRARGAVPRTR
jgi:tetratricopeptide (TPR) repeat protein